MYVNQPKEVCNGIVESSNSLAIYSFLLSSRTSLIRLAYSQIKHL
jgi:hypothetical protein